MKITHKHLTQWNACQDGVTWFKRKYGNKSVEHLTVLNDLWKSRAYKNWIEGNGHYTNQACWLIIKVLKNSICDRQYLHFVWDDVQEIVEIHYWVNKCGHSVNYDKISDKILKKFNVTRDDINKWAREIE